MTTRLMDRRNTRILFDVPVDIVDRHGRKTLQTRSVDLSRGGIRLASAVSWEVGTPLTCQFRLGKEKTFVTGKVVWSDDGDEADVEPSVGIEFIDLSSLEQTRLRSVVGDPTPVSHRVDVEFAEGRLPGKIRRSKQGLQLDVRLDFLARGRPIQFSITEDGKTNHYTGDVGNVWAVREKRGIPIASMDVDVCWNANDSEIEVESTGFALNGQVFSSQSDTEKSTWIGLEKKSGLSTWGALAIGLFVVFGLTSVLWVFGSLVTGDPVDANKEMSRSKASQLPPVRFVDNSPNHKETNLNNPKSSEPSQLNAVVETKDSSPTKTLSTTAVAPPKGRLVGVPVVERKGEEVVVTVDLKGSLREASYYRLAKPDALGVNLPHAHVEKSQSYVFHRDGIRLVLVRPRDKGAHVRVFFENKAPKYRVDTQGDRIVIRYTPNRS